MSGFRWRWSSPKPGTVDEVVRPILEETGLRGGDDFFLAFSPERVDPGNTQWTTANIPKVVGGIDADSTAVAQALYEQVVNTVVAGVVAARSRDGEAAGEHIPRGEYRASQRIGSDEPSARCRRLGGDRRCQHQAVRIHAVLPWAWAGGHCIPIDPYYLSWKARQSGFESRFIELPVTSTRACPGLSWNSWSRR